MLSSVEILILATIQGISEFLPVSSTAHLVLFSQYYEFSNQNLLIDISLHLGSLIAIIFYFRKDLFNFIKNKSFLIKIIVGTIPIIPVGYILYQTGLINHLRSLEIIGWTSLIFGILLYLFTPVVKDTFIIVYMNLSTYIYFWYIIHNMILNQSDI